MGCGSFDRHHSVAVTKPVLSQMFWADHSPSTAAHHTWLFAIRQGSVDRCLLTPWIWKIVFLHRYDHVLAIFTEDTTRVIETYY